MNTSHGLVLLAVVVVVIIVLIVWLNWNHDSPDDNSIVALLELSGTGWVQHDQAVAEYLRIKHPDVVIMDTYSDPEMTLDLLRKQHAMGTKNFIAGSRSTMLEYIRPYILSNPDINLISVGSTAIPLAVEDNIYRLLRPDTNLIEVLPRFFRDDVKTSHIHFLTQIGDEWTTSTTAALVPAFEDEGITVTVSYINIDLSQKEIGRELEEDIPTRLPKDAIFMAFIAGNDNEKFYESLRYSPKSTSRDHYAGDATAFFEFGDIAKEQALIANLRAYSYVPNSTPESVSLTQEVSNNLGFQAHPFAVVSVDAITAFKNNNDDNMLETLDRTYGITGSLSSDINGDRVTGNYVWFMLSEEWNHDLILGRSLEYGDFSGYFY